VDEVADVLTTHLARGEDAIASFGQGCEGEPLLRADVIAEAVARARKSVPWGTVNVNTNGSRPETVASLADAGVNSLRVTLASADPATYHAYHQPVEYTFDQVAETIDRAKSRGVWVSVNLLVLPGVTDTRDHAKKLIAFLWEHSVDMLQMRNLNLDPDAALEALVPIGPGKGIPWLLRKLERELPEMVVGSFNRPVGR
jgi:MoaA/NifB/PqqE/SkfB family radical SAM enzyme